jgi:hypothetical protein
MIALLPVGVLGARNPRNLLMDNRVQSHLGTNEAFLNIFLHEISPRRLDREGD